MKRLSGIDATFLYMETPSMHMHVVGTLVLEPDAGVNSYEQVVRLIRERLHLLPPFRRRLVMTPLNLGHPAWFEDPDFDLETHIRHIAVPPPATRLEFGEVVGEIASVPLDRSKPLWEAWVVEGLEGGRVALVTKIHHALIDGVTGADLMAHILDIEPDAPPPPPPADEWQPETPPSDLSMLTGAVGHVVGNPVRFGRFVARTARGAFEVVRRHREAVAANPDELPPAMPFTAPRVGWNGSLTPHRSVAVARTSLDDLKFTKGVFGTTVNDVVLATVTQTLRAYLTAHDDLPDKPLIASVPVSVHGQSAHEATNQVSSLFVRLPVHVADSVEQLMLIKQDTTKAKEVHNAIGADMLQDFAQFVAPAVFNRAMRLYSNLNLADRHRPVQNLVVSNVPGPPIPLYTAGARVDALYPFGPLIEGAGLNITVFSNMGFMDFGLVACTELVPDHWHIADGWVEAVAALRQAADRAAQPA